MSTTEEIRVEGRGEDENIQVMTGISRNLISQQLKYLVFSDSSSGEVLSSFISEDGGLSLTRSSSGKQLKITSDGTLAGTTVSTADDNTEINNVESIDINIGSNGISAVVKCSSVEVALNT